MHQAVEIEDEIQSAEQEIDRSLNTYLIQARRHRGAFRGRAPEMTACAFPNENCAPQARTVPRRN